METITAQPIQEATGFLDQVTWTLFAVFGAFAVFGIPVLVFYSHCPSNCTY